MFKSPAYLLGCHLKGRRWDDEGSKCRRCFREEIVIAAQRHLGPVPGCWAGLTNSSRSPEAVVLCRAVVAVAAKRWRSGKNPGHHRLPSLSLSFCPPSSLSLLRRSWNNIWSEDIGGPILKILPEDMDLIINIWSEVMGLIISIWSEDISPILNIWSEDMSPILN